MEAAKSTSFLIVDDFELMRKTLRNNLISLGFDNIMMAGDGEEAIKILKNHSVDCIISDWNMPRMTGLQLLQYIRCDVQYQNMHFMMVTAEGERNMVNRAIDAGVDQFLVKPFTQITLRDKVSTMLKHGPRVLSKSAVATNQSANRERQAKEAASKNSKPLILAVDDVATNIAIIADTLKDNYKIKAANSGVAALKICSNARQPDLILLDIMMPEMDGYQICETLKNNPKTAHIPVIFLTAKSETIDMKKGFELGAVDYITKPCNPDILKARVATHTKLKLSKDALEERVDTLVENARLREDVERITRHDLKNPLSAIIGSCEAILNDKWVPNCMSSVENIREASMSMLGMINRTLDIYKIEAGIYRPKLERVNLAELMHRMVNSFRMQAQNRTINIVYQAPSDCIALAEEMLCISMFGNLLNNAVEASPDGENIYVTTNQVGDVCEVSINNVGEIPQEIQTTLFDKYVTAGKQGGTGLGTYSAKLMAETQKGRIRFDTSPYEGTTFYVQLPIA
ncbi:response regulator [Vibrio nitrifigilis]|uniref:histidine kinase n=1 Tax=Vibrio nitrifigilis TaxID=2789781 RepID=A0ABS0GKG9_9VIBR|nr:response regulator [Vibrio nitrifigilis]MBF9002810.1 response regulator [Vibrio nitrifigilis]